MESVWFAVRLALRVVIGCLVVLVALLVVHFLVVLGVFDGPLRNPYEKDDICFVRAWPGATSRYVEYSFVSCTQPQLPLAGPFGADQAVLAFEDVDGDGEDEAVIESSRYKCKFGGLGCFGAGRYVLDICSACQPKVSVVSSRDLPELERH